MSLAQVRGNLLYVDILTSHTFLHPITWENIDPNTQDQIITSRTSVSLPNSTPTQLQSNWVLMAIILRCMCTPISHIFLPPYTLPLIENSSAIPHLCADMFTVFYTMFKDMLTTCLRHDYTRFEDMFTLYLINPFTFMLKAETTQYNTVSKFIWRRAFASSCNPATWNFNSTPIQLKSN